MDIINCINIAKMLKEIQRVLKFGGFYMIISYEDPESKMIHLNRKFLKYKVGTIKVEQKDDKGKENYNYIYLFQKLEGSDEVSKKFFDETINELIEDEEMEEDDQVECQEKNENNVNIIKNKNFYDKINNDYIIMIHDAKNNKESNIDKNII